jgi:hypothetical protein
LMVMLEKKPGVIIPDKLCAITLLEADFNSTNKIILGKRMMANAEEHGLVQQEAVGSRKGHSTHEIALNRRLATDISRLQNKTLGVASLDAAQCYDCITHTPGSIACQRLGAPPPRFSC